MKIRYTKYKLLTALFLLLAVGFSACENNAEFAVSDGGGGSGANKGGSLARFTVKGDYLYTVSEGRRLNTFSLQQADKPTFASTTNLRFENVETIFPYQNYLFFGTQNGMLIYSLENPISPTFVSEITHVRSYDPVVAQGNWAYVTLRNGRNFGINELQVISIADMRRPTLMRQYPMHAPAGLSIENDLLFICDGEEGLKVFNAADPLNLSLLQSFPDLHAKDVITHQNLLILIGEDGLRQYYFTPDGTMEKLCEILVQE
ncbi:LVIVD repeat-containing protein [Hugenholtzia roseola]|uniref:LVIVD repeat-containing protein n=1 Tax=Hugenholtzia roseola TaxID=1002 RepID=UPI0012B5B95A|nr:hypothetical protein [Hugenholtzia roseola]